METFSSYPISFPVSNNIMSAGNSGHLQISVLQTQENGEVLVAQGDVVPFKVLSSLNDTDTNIGEYTNTIEQLIAEFNSSLEDINSREIAANKVSVQEDVIDKEKNYPSIQYLKEYYYNALELDEYLEKNYYLKEDVYAKDDLNSFLFGNTNVYSTFDELKSATFTASEKAYILGYYKPGDGGAALYSIDTTGEIELVNSPNFYATLIVQPQMNIECFGARGDGETDDSQIISIASNYNTQIVFGNKTYRIAKPIRVENDINWIGNETIFKIDSDIALDLTSPGEYSEEVWINLKEDFENYNRGIFNIKGQTKIEGISFKYEL